MDINIGEYILQGEMSFRHNSHSYKVLAVLIREMFLIFYVHYMCAPSSFEVNFAFDLNENSMGHRQFWSTLFHISLLHTNNSELPTLGSGALSKPCNFSASLHLLETSSMLSSLYVVGCTHFIVNFPCLKLLNSGQNLDSCHVFSPRKLKCWNSE